MDGVKLGEVREFTIEGWNGEKVHMWAIYPPDFDPKKKWPLLHNIHGGPALEPGATTSTSAGTTTCSPRRATWSCA